MENLKLIVYAGIFQLWLAFFLAWIMVGTGHFKLPFFTQRVKSYRDLIKAHLDYILMALLLITFGNTYKNLETAPGFLTTLLVIYGSSINPLGFLIPAFNPSVDNQPFLSCYRGLVFSGFVATTLGFGLIGMDILCNI